MYLLLRPWLMLPARGRTALTAMVVLRQRRLQGRALALPVRRGFFILRLTEGLLPQPNSSRMPRLGGHFSLGRAGHCTLSRIRRCGLNPMLPTGAKRAHDDERRGATLPLIERIEPVEKEREAKASSLRARPTSPRSPAAGNCAFELLAPLSSLN